MSLDAFLERYRGTIRAIRSACAEELKGFEDAYVLRFAIEHNGDTLAAVKNVKEVVAWRRGEGKAIVRAAAQAFAKATAGGGWDNAPVLAAAPHSAVISKYLTPSQMVVVSLSNGDLCTCIRASAIDDRALMDAVSVEQLVEFFLYAGEVNSLVAEQRTLARGRLVRLLQANDFSGASRFPDSRFTKAATDTSKMAVTLYPGLSGPTILLNLPSIVRWIVELLKPLFPGAVQQKLRFARKPMARLDDLSDVLREPTRSAFIGDLEAALDD